VNTEGNKMLTASQDRSETRLSQSNLISFVDRLMGPVHMKSHTSALVLRFAPLRMTFL